MFSCVICTYNNPKCLIYLLQSLLLLPSPLLGVSPLSPVPLWSGFPLLCGDSSMGSVSLPWVCWLGRGRASCCWCPSCLCRVCFRRVSFCVTGVPFAWNSGVLGHPASLCSRVCFSCVCSLWGLVPLPSPPSWAVALSTICTYIKKKIHFLFQQ